MTGFEINKYPPALMTDGRYLREDWGACTDIGVKVTKADYLAMEAKYVDTIVHLIDWAGAPVAARNVEHWYTHSDDLTRLGLDDVFATPLARPVDGAVLPPTAIPNIARRCLREVAWLELVAAGELSIHFGYDYRLRVATRADPAPVYARARALGLYVHA